MRCSRAKLRVGLGADGAPIILQFDDDSRHSRLALRADFLKARFRPVADVSISEHRVWMRAIFAGLLLSATMLSSVGKAGDTPQCSPPAAIKQVPISGLPQAIRATLRGQLGVIAEPGEKFDNKDVVVTDVNRRFIFAWTLRGRWIVAIEQGSLSHNDPVLRFDPDARGMLTFTGLRIAAPETVCREASALLEGARP